MDKIIFFNFTLEKNAFIRIYDYAIVFLSWLLYFNCVCAVMWLLVFLSLHHGVVGCLWSDIVAFPCNNHIFLV